MNDEMKKQYIKPIIKLEIIEEPELLAGSGYINWDCDNSHHGWENCKGACGHKSNAPCHNHGNQPMNAKEFIFFNDDPYDFSIDE